MTLRKLLSVTIFLFALNISKGQESEVKSIKLNESNNSFQVLESTKSYIAIKNSISQFNIKEAITTTGNYIELEINHYANSNILGNPKLPVKKKLIEIPLEANVRVEIQKELSQEIFLKTNTQIVPLQESVAKSKEANDYPFHKNLELYNQNKFIETNIATVEVLGIYRNKRLARLNIEPFSYNPATNSLRVYTDIQVHIYFENGDFDATEKLKRTAPTKQAGQLLNSKTFTITNKTQSAPIKYLVISDPQFKDSLQQFINWKTQEGFDVIEVYKGENGVGSTADDIKTHLKSLYDSATPESPAPLYALIVGDIDQIPSFNGNKGNHISDLHYFEYTNDYFPELYYGRFSANNISELMPQIYKTIEYEKYEMSDKSFLDKATLVSGVDNVWGNGYANAHTNYGAEYYFNEENGYTSYNYLQPNSGNNADEIKSKVSDGVGILKYSGHCLASGWLNPEFNYNDIYLLNNDGKYPTVVSNCCESTRFENYASFGEVWLRTNNKGAVGHIGSSNLSYWVEDYFFDIGYDLGGGDPKYEETTLAAMDLMFHTHNESEELWAVNNGQVLQAGNLAVTEAGTDRVDYYWETYHLMGDPSLMTYLTTPEELVVKHPENIYIGLNQISVTAERGAYVAISSNNILFDAKFADLNGNVVLSIPYLDEKTDINIVATKQNKQPYIGIINGIKQPNADIILLSHKQNESQGNNNEIIEYGEDATLDLTLSNIGYTATSKLNLTLTTESEKISLTTNSYSIESLNLRSELNITEAFSFKVSSTILGENTIPFVLSITDENDEIWELAFEIKVYGPEFLLSKVNINDQHTGNNNLNLDAGEIVNLNFIIENNGISDSKELSGTISCLNSNVNILNSYNDSEVLEANGSLSGSYAIALASEIEANTPIELLFNFKSGDHTYSTTKTLNVGKPTDDFENNNLNSFNWIIPETNPWVLVEADDSFTPFSGNGALKSATINHADTSTIELSINSLIKDSIVFYKKVSSQLPSAEGVQSDFLEFYIDGVSMGKWGGEIDWSKEVYLLNEGNHTLSWKYIKSKFISSGADCAWIDRIQIPNDSRFSSNDAPIFTSLPDTVVNLNATYNYSIEVSDNDNVDIKANKLPEWLSLSSTENNSAILSGSTKDVIPGKYLIMLSAFDGLSSNYQTYILHVKDPNGNKINATQDLVLFPNPSTGIVYLSNSIQNILYINVYNTMGKQLMSIQKTKTPSPNINLSEFKDGIYFIQVKTKTESITRKLLLSK